MTKYRKGERLIRSVEDITVIDSFVVDKQNLLDVYKLGSQAGSIEITEAEGDDIATEFVNEMGDKKIVSAKDENGNKKLYASVKLIDKWSKPQKLRGINEEVTELNFPFLESDGTTLYFAAKSDDNLGGYDIYITRADSDENSYFKPDNLGYPFNSVYNDYMLAIDEYNQLGWFASDRFQPEGKVCVYVFIPNETKRTYNYDEMDKAKMISLAKLDNISLTQNDKNEIIYAKQRLAKVSYGSGKKRKKENDFIFIVNDNRIYTSMKHFSKAESKKMFQEMTNMQNDLETLEKAVQKALLLTEKPSDLPPLLETLHKGTAEALAAASRLLEEAEKQESAMQRAREAGEALRHTCGEARAACLALEKEALGLAAEARGLENGLARLETLCREGLGELQKDMRPFGVEGEDTDMLEQGLRRLEARRDAFLALQKEEKNLRSAGDELSRAAAACAEKLAGAAAACEEGRNSLARRRQERQNLALARKQLFGLRDPEQEEKKATLLLRAEEAEETRLEREAERAKSACEQAGSALAVLAERLARRAETLLVMERELNSGLAAAGFADEKACRAALMAEKDLHVLEEKENALNRRALALETRGRELARRRDGLVSPALSPEDCARSMEETRREREETLRNLGGIGEILRANAIRKKEEGELRERRNAQALLCGKWKALDDLIGSADGKKFRNYAQELTFRALLGLANRQLAQMTDRYELTYSSTEALTLNVIDRYQADAVRSSRNLSGGESFIVSLALALALAQMAGRNVRVDSVFLDEGFGTLDEEALNTALDMLSALHEKGKVIGIISHVQAVRDRVPVQIAVEPAGNGRSRLSGPGVSGGNG